MKVSEEGMPRNNVKEQNPGPELPEVDQNQVVGLADFRPHTLRRFVCGPKTFRVQLYCRK